MSQTRKPAPTVVSGLTDDIAPSARIIVTDSKAETWKSMPAGTRSRVKGERLIYLLVTICSLTGGISIKRVGEFLARNDSTRPDLFSCDQSAANVLKVTSHVYGSRDCQWALASESVFLAVKRCILSRYSRVRQDDVARVGV